MTHGDVLRIPIARPCIGDGEVEAVAEVLRSGMLVQGPVGARFERTFADYVSYDRKTAAIAVNSCTSALHLAMLASGRVEPEPQSQASWAVAWSRRSSPGLSMPISLGSDSQRLPE